MKFPAKCPYCNKDIADVDISAETHFFQSKKKETDKKPSVSVAASVYTCIHCNKNIYIIRAFASTPAKGPVIFKDEILSCFPLPRNFKYPFRVKELSPKSFEIYTQAFQANDLELNFLVGAGLRIALERLIWDYLTKIQNIPENELNGKMLGNLIKMLEGNIKESLYIRVLQYFGNKSIHVSDQENFSAEEAFAVYDMLLDELDLILHNNELEEKLNTLKST